MAKVSAAEREAIRDRLLGSAGREFRLHGYGGAGVDALAKAAGVTSGALYAHFGSKAEIFRAALVAGLGDLRGGVRAYRDRFGTTWLRRFATWYLSGERRSDLAASCALPALTLEAARGDAETRALYTSELRAIVDDVRAGLAGARRDADTLAILALLSGGMTMAHAVDDERLGAQIARAVSDAIARIGAPRAT